MTKTITINIDEKIDEEFRDMVKTKYGKGKGSLGRAFEEALEYFIRHRKDGDPDEHLLMLAEKGFRLGKLTTNKRGEWHRA
jgi:hypothetical protein